MVLSADPVRDPSTLAIIGAGAALAISDIPFHYVLCAVRVGMVDGKMVVNPTYEESKAAKINIVVAGTEEGIVMVESGSQQASEAEVLSCIDFGHECCKKIAAGIRELVAKTGKKKMVFTPPPVNETLYEQISAAASAELKDAMNTQKYDKLDSYARVDACKHKVIDALPEEQQPEGKKLFDALKERIFRDEMLKDRRRPDGRAFDEIRKLDIEVGVLPRTHGSSLFTRGETQALVTATLGTKDDEQRIELLDSSETSKRFMLHYNFPPFSVGEVGFMRGAGRREIGHGALAERALSAVVPDDEVVPLHHARGQRHSGVEWIELDGLGLRRDAFADGRGRADCGSRGGHRHGPGEGRQGLRGADRYRGRRRSLRRHGLQGRGNQGRHHRAADGYQGAQRHPGGPD